MFSGFDIYKEIKGDSNIGIFQEIEGSGRLLFQYVRGSHLYGINTEESDIDTGGLFIEGKDRFYSLPSEYSEMVSNKRSDHTLYEIGKFASLILKSNPNVLEVPFVPEKMWLKKPHPCLNPLFEARDQFITKKCFYSFGRYASEQIHKARGLNKKITKPIVERKSPIDFCYTFRGKGSTKMVDWLSDRGIDQKYCGLLKIPNMEGIYAVYLDWKPLLESIQITHESVKQLEKWILPENCSISMSQFFNLNELALKNTGVYIEDKRFFSKNNETIGYRGMFDSFGNEPRLSSIPKGISPICYMSYNAHGYSAHCVDYREYKDWEKHRNPVRYQSNLNQNYDSKNMCHCLRLIMTCIDIARGNGLILERSEEERKLLLDIRNHKYEYDELIDMVLGYEGIMQSEMEKSTIPDEVDKNLVNDILIDIRKNFYS